MKKVFKSLLLSAAALAVSAPTMQAQPTADPIKREFRSVWMAALGIDFGASSLKSALEEYTTELAAQNFTSLCFHVRPMADALYQSSLVPWSHYASGTRGQAPSFDPLAHAIEQAHSKGLELYAWMNPYRWQSGTTTVTYSTTYDKQWKANGWAMANNEMVALNPAMPEVRAHIVAVVKELIENYNVDGIIFDDYFYPNGGYTTSSSAVDYKLWKNSGTSLSFADWRREQVNLMVRDVYNVIQEVKPDVRFVISPAGMSGTSATKYGFPSPWSGYGISASDWQYDQIYSDPMAWLAEGTIDAISPQLYWRTTHSTNPFGPLTKWYSDCAKIANRHHYASHSLSALASGTNTTSDWADYVKQINYSRQYTQNNAPGYVMFSLKNLNGVASAVGGSSAKGVGDYIYNNASSKKVLQPEVTWHKDKEHAFTAPANAKKSGSTLTWDAQSYGNRIVKYSVYAVPTSLDYDAAASSDGDGISSEYLLGITYTNSYTIPTGKTSGYWYAICVYDGFSNEWDPAFVGYSQEPAPATTLQSPSNGGSVTGVFSLNWSAVDVDEYFVEVSKASDFSSLAFSTTTTGTSVSLQANQLGAGTYYWRVTTKKNGCKATTTSSRNFKVTVSNAPATTLQSPASGTTVAGVFFLAWSSVGVDSYTVEVSKSSGFSSTIYSKNLTSTSVSLDAADLGEGTYYWRVKTHKAGYNDNTTSSRTFKIAGIPDAALPTLTAPANNAVVEGNFDFSWSNAGVDNYTLQVSNSSDFSTILYSTVTAETKVSQVADFFGKGTFYWRVISHDAGCKDATTASRVFKIEKVTTGMYEDGYVIKTDGEEYDLFEDITLTNTWTRSVSLGNFSQNSTDGSNAGTFNRDFVASGDFLYVAGRDANDQTAMIYLRKYDRYTGEHVSDVMLSDNGQVYFYPCNNLTKDSKGVVCVSNLTLNISSRPLYIHSVDLETGELTEVAALTYSSSSSRVDHCEVYGDVAGGNFYVFAPLPNTNTVVRWTIKNGVVNATEATTIGRHFPSSAASFGIAPSLIPMSETDFFVDGEYTAMSRYTFRAGRTATLVDSFGNASYNGAMTEASYYNGGVVFTFNNEKYIGFTSTLETSEADVTEDHQFDIVKTNDNLDYSSMKFCWRLPALASIFGNQNSTSKQAPMDYLDNGDKTGTVYAYVPGAGIAAYTLGLKDEGESGVENIVGKDNVNIFVAGRWIHVSEEASSIAVFNLAGSAVAVGEGLSVYADVAPGYYVVRAIVDGRMISKGVVIR